MLCTRFKFTYRIDILFFLFFAAVVYVPLCFSKYSKNNLQDLIYSLNILQMYNPLILLAMDQLNLEQLNTFCINECTSNSSDSYFDFYKLIEKFDCELIQYNNYSGESSLSIYKSIGS